MSEHTHEYETGDALDHASLHAQGIPHTHDDEHTHGHGHHHSTEHIRQVTNRLARAIGHLESVKKMVEEDRYCIDISTQVMATEALLKRVNREILAAHLEHCVKDAAEGQERQAKIDEFVDTLNRILK